MSQTLSIGEFVDSVGFADLASGKLTAGAQHAIVVVRQLADGRAFVFDEWANRTSTEVLTENIFRLNSHWRPRCFGIDATGQQHLYFDMLSREAALRRERISLVAREFTVAEGSKEFRLTTIISRWMHNGLLFINQTCKQLLHQLSIYPTGTLVDLVDALAGALSLLRDPLTGHGKLVYDPAYDETARWQRTLRNDRRLFPGYNENPAHGAEFSL